MKAFVISLPSAMDRRRRIESMLAAADAQFEIVDAIAGTDIAGSVDQYCPQRYCPRHRCELTLNEIACCLSHRKAIIRFIETNLQWGLILEDDAYIERSNFDILNKIEFSQIDFDILKIGGFERVKGKLKASYGELDILAVEKPSMGAHAYIVSQDGARKLVATSLPIKHQYDSFLRHTYMHGCSIYETVPHLANQSDFGESMIGVRALRSRPITPYEYSLSAAWQIKHNFLRLVYRIKRFGFARI